MTTPSKSITDLWKSDKKWLIEYMNNNPGANQIDNYIISINTLRENASCALDQQCLLKCDSEADPDCEELRLFLLCFSCDRIFHQKCSNTAEDDLINEKTPWICPQCSNNPLNQDAVDFFRSGRHNLSLKERLLRYAVEVEIPSPLKKVDETLSDDDDDSLFDIPTIEKSLHVNFHNMELMDVSKILGTKLVYQQKEFNELKNSFIATEKERLKLVDELAKKSAENEICMKKLHKLEQSMNERLFLQDTKLKNLEGSHKMPTGRQSPPSLLPLSSTVISQEHRNVSFDLPQNVDGKFASSRQANSNAAQKLREVSFSLKVLKANDIKEQVAKELNFSSTKNSENRDINHSNIINKSSSHSNEPTIQSVTLEHVNRLNLNEIRKNLPKIEQFDGNVDKWLTFERAITRNRREGQYSDELTKYHIRQALTGQALARVDDLIDVSTADEIMSFLKQCYGCSNNIVANARKKLLAVKLARPLNYHSAMEVTTKIASYMSACKYANLPVLDMSISLHIHNQLEPVIQQQYYNFYFAQNPGQTRMERLDVQFEFINEIAKTLPMGESKSTEKKELANKNSNYQVFSTSVAVSDEENTSQYNLKSANSKSKDDFKYEIRDREKAPYMGYNMEKVAALPKECIICDKNNHYPVECNLYRDMAIDQKYNTIKSKGICQNCLLTNSHQTNECDVKLGCGFNVDNYNKCAQKHHISLHRGSSHKSNNLFKKQNRRASANKNAANANEKIQQHELNTASSQEASTSAHPLTTQVPSNNAQISNSKYSGYPMQSASISVNNRSNEKCYHMCSLRSHNTHESSQRTVKLFRTFFYGNDKKAVGFAVGDSAAEVTLVKKELINDLGIVGEPCFIELQWTDSLVKTTPAIKVNLQISGILPDNEMLELTECYAVADLKLSSRSLNVEKLKEQFPYLQDVAFESYYNAVPCLLIGSRHAHMIEAIEAVKEGGNCKPVAIKSKLGYTIYGGAPESHPNSTPALQSISKSNDIDNQSSILNNQSDHNYENAFSVGCLGIRQIENHRIKDDQKTYREHKKIPKLTNKNPANKQICITELSQSNEFSPVVPSKNAISDILLPHHQNNNVYLENLINLFKIIPNSSVHNIYTMYKNLKTSSKNRRSANKNKEKNKIVTYGASISKANNHVKHKSDSRFNADPKKFKRTGENPVDKFDDKWKKRIKEKPKEKEAVKPNVQRMKLDEEVLNIDRNAGRDSIFNRIK